MSASSCIVYNRLSIDFSVREVLLMKKKQNDLLKFLLLQSRPMTSTEIGNALSISTRSVKNYVSDINSLYNKKIILSSRNGYEINRQVSPSLIIDNSEDVPQTGEERAFYIIKQLVLYHTSHLELFELCENLCVSYSTIKSVISKMNKTFSSYNVEFLCENDCVRIKGEEKDKRKLISYIINEESKTSFIDTQQLKDCFQNIDIDRLYAIVTQNFKKHNFYLNDFATINLLLHLVIIIDRELNGNPLETGTSDIRMESEHEEALLLQLVHDLQEEFHMQLNAYEQFEIHMLIKANANYTIATTKSDLQKIVGAQVIALTDYYIKQINSLYFVDLSEESFSTPFSLHLKNLLFRLRSGKSTGNPMADSIKLNSPVVFDMAIYIALDLMERYNVSVNEDETAFLAMHIGAEIERQNMNRSKTPVILLCPDYRNLCVDLLNKLLLNFGNQINIVRSVHDEAALQDIDVPYAMLFTTIPLHHTYACEIIQISPFNLSQQYELIQEAIVSSQDRYKNYKLRTNFHTFFEEDLYVSNPDMTNKHQILTYLCDLLHVKHYTDTDFEEKVYRRENAATTAFGNIAIPHSMDMDAIKTSIAVAVSKKGIQWGTNTVHLVLLLAINKADKKTFRQLYESLISLFSEDSIIQEVRNCITFQDFETLIYSSIENE